jgi:hypothetical protein
MTIKPPKMNKEAIVGQSLCFFERIMKTPCLFAYHALFLREATTVA